jgi:hypothetical protein
MRPGWRPQLRKGGSWPAWGEFSAEMRPRLRVGDIELHTGMLAGRGPIDCSIVQCFLDLLWQQCTTRNRFGLMLWGCTRVSGCTTGTLLQPCKRGMHLVLGIRLKTGDCLEFDPAVGFAVAGQDVVLGFQRVTLSARPGDISFVHKWSSALPTGLLQEAESEDCGVAVIMFVLWLVHDFRLGSHFTMCGARRYIYSVLHSFSLDS